MTKINQIISYLETEKTDVAVVSDPVTINYLTGFYSDPHERQMFLFIFTNHEPLLFVPALEVDRASAIVDFKVVGYVDSENPWEKIKAALPADSAHKVAVEFDNLILTKYNGLRTVFEQAEFTNLTPCINRMRLIKSSDEIKKMFVAGEYADKAVKIGLKKGIYHLNKFRNTMCCRFNHIINDKKRHTHFNSSYLFCFSFCTTTHITVR